LPRKRLFATVPTTEQFFLNASFGGNWGQATFNSVIF
jgi:hypothetical protein